MTSFEEHLRHSVEEVNKLHQINGGSQDRVTPRPDTGSPDMPAGAMPPRPAYDFVSLNDKVADSLIETVEQSVTLAENLRAEAQALAERMKADIAAMDDRIFNTNARLKVLGTSILAAHKKFHEGE